MAFLTGNNGKKYFSIYYYSDSDGRVTGTFHELNLSQWTFLARWWRVEATIVGGLFLSQLILYILYLSGLNSTGWVTEAWKFYILAMPALITPIALYVAPKPRVMLVDERVEIERKSSSCIYLASFCFVLSLNLSLLWMTQQNIRIPIFSISLWVFSVAAIFFVYRFFAVLRS